MQPPLDLKQILPFPLEPAPTLGLFSNYSTMDPVQKAVLSHTFGGPLLKTKRPVISCNVCQIRFNSQSQAEAHYKGNRHARRVKGIEAAKTRGREPGIREPGDPAPPGSTPTNGDGVAPRPVSMENGLGPAPGSPEKQPGSPSPPSIPETGQGVTKGEGGTPAPASLPGGSKEEEEKAKRLLYCALCKVAVNSLSQLEAHNKGTKHKTILEARSGLGPIKAYPRLGPPTPGEPEAPAQDRTFHCEICNVKVNSEVQLKQRQQARRCPCARLQPHLFSRDRRSLTLCFTRPPDPSELRTDPSSSPPTDLNPEPLPFNSPPPAGTQASGLPARLSSRHSLNDLSFPPPPRDTGFQERGGVAGEGGFRRGGTPQISGNPAPCLSLSPRKGGAVSPPSPLGDTPPPKSHVHPALPPQT
uniref:Zinc finger protein 385A n=1 Tax=Macaca fascicularis TaxID=9541 RepID=A0A2K5VZ75_MACFA